MALQFWLPLITSLAASGIGGAVSAGTTSAANRREAEMAAKRREIIQRMINEVRGGGAEAGASLDEQANRDFSRAADQIGAQSAATGMTNAGRGGQDALQAETLGGILAALAQAKQQDDLQRQQVIANMINDPAFMVPEPGSFNPGSDALLGGLAGLASGGLNTMASFMGTEAGMEMLLDMFGGGGSGAPSLNAGQLGANRTQSDMARRASRGDGGLSSITPRRSHGSGSGFLSNPMISNVTFGR